MIDRALGIVGIALALLTGAVQAYFPQSPAWTQHIGYGLGIFLGGTSVGLILAGGFRRKRVTKPAALLRLHIFGDHRTPDRIALDNVFRWYWMHNIVEGIAPQGRHRIATFMTLFISFEDDVVIHTLNVRSPDMQIPPYEVKEFNQRYAIIAFTDNVPAGTLEVTVTS